MRTFFTRVFRFFWSWGFLKFVLGVVALVILFYVEEDWRGASMWAATKKKWEAQGESFDYRKFIPSPVPDEQNLAALPLFELGERPSTDATSPPALAFLKLEAAIHRDDSSVVVPNMGKWMRGELPDFAAIDASILASYKHLFGDKTPPHDALAEFDEIFPITAGLRSAAATRPFYRLNLNYDVSPPLLREYGPLTASISICKILALHSILALQKNQKDVALQDLQVGAILIQGTQKDPTLVAGLVALGNAAVLQAAIHYGLATHEWGDAQLAAIIDMEKKINFLSGFQFAIRGECASTIANIQFYRDKNNAETRRLLFWNDDKAAWNWIPWSKGWWDDNARSLADFHFEQVATVDPASRVVLVSKANQLSAEVEREVSGWTASLPTTFWFTEAAGSEESSIGRFVQGQVWIDESRIACALERCRLAKGKYPAALEELAPAYIDAAPRDIMNGQPYHYHANEDGTFLLYSVGWDQMDNGGTVVFETNSPNIPSYEHGDWVWPAAK